MESPAPELDATVEPGHIHVQATSGERLFQQM